MSEQHDFPTGVTLRVGIFFDGTGNNQCNLALGGYGEAGSYGNSRSNVALLHALYPTGMLGDQLFIKRYVPGVGTREGAADSFYGQATGRGSTGVEARVAEVLAWFENQRHAGPLPARLAFDLFGFSRGAAAARHLANRLAEVQWPINFIGLFDTVAAIVAPLSWDFDPADTRNGALRLGLAPGIARHVVQLVAGDEQRHNFPLVRSANDIVVPGVHANVGGGYKERMHEQVQLCKPFSQRVAQSTPVERTEAYAQAVSLLQTSFTELGAPAAQVLSWEEPVVGGAVQRFLAQKQVYAAVHREREVLGHLSRVYLSLMRELGVRGGVPFAPLGGEPEHRLPAELRGISHKVHGFALGDCSQLQLTGAERQLLQGRYVHTSAHWNALNGMRNSRLDWMYVHRPAPKGRVMHDNPLG
ncbi:MULTISPECIES: T6SS phospholipase effector Tle1-like catalytic domain-containing protein [unclassified Pseudomonas]|uniref:phospholipase effector Tle1 domain-containing protein n=1 Tax=unclassified Pseudomonas TaxID=196821 RepID=UPI0021BA45E2|nr:MULTISPECIES: DUF2235 domain-containing protein [unclassified Pseudomonas]MCT8162391.1 DUF2235 domain-containing protein [Pseudomonas sp. HD6422]MCT8183783.1 DUF2235 domain-containing protein [Pseudomonas sp. HD6421]